MTRTTTTVTLSRELAQVPITAVALHRDPATGALHVLAGVDTDLVIYRVPDDDDTGAGADDDDDQGARREVARVRDVLSAQPIHGIRAHRTGALLLWGGPSVAALHLADPSRVVARLQAPDWIHDGAACPADDALVALVTAHNEVLTARRSADGQRLLLLQEEDGLLAAPSRPMLYAAHVCWTSASEVLVAAGTVFGDVLVWTRDFGSGNGGGGAPRMLYTLSGHEGSIFGVHVSPLMEVPGAGRVRLLASCSDDRTIRVWDITEGEGGAAGEETSPAAAAAVAATGVSDTGFRCAPAVGGGEGGAGGGRADRVPIATAMGHASRIWGVRFGVPDAQALTAAQLEPWTDGGRGGAVSVYSFGEDATAQRWSVDVAAALRGPRQQQQLTHEKTHTLHDGKHLWSRAVVCDTVDGVPTTHVLAGGADSKISLVRDVPAARDDGAQTWDMHDVLASMGRTPPSTQQQQRKELLGRYDFVTPDVLLAVGSMGTVLLATLAEGGRAATWEAVTVADEAAREDMRNVYAVRTVARGGALLGSVTGGVYYFGLRDRRVTRIAGLAGRVVEITALSETLLDVEGRGGGGEVEALVHLHRDAASVLLTLDRATGALRREAEAVAGLDARFVAMSAARIGDDLLAMGSRHGWIALLRRDDAGGEGGAFRPVLDVPPASGDAVTAIVPLPASRTSPATKHVLTTSRDGKYRIFQLDLVAAAAPRMTLVHETAPPFGPWIEGAWFSRDAGDLILYGFRSTDFVVWNETRREELAATRCGGAHRTFRLARGSGGGSGSSESQLRLAFTRTSRLAVHSPRCAAAAVRAGHHGREVRSVAVSRTGRYVATGAEDTTIRIWATSNTTTSSSSSAMRPVAYLKRHVVGLQKLQWCPCGNDDDDDAYLFSAGGNEELFAWRVRTLLPDNDDECGRRVAVVCEGALRRRPGAREDLRITDLDVLLSEADGAGMLVTVALSDSALRTYRYAAGEGFTLVREGRYTGACLTQARHLGGGEVVTAATDGHLGLWRAGGDGGGGGGGYELVRTLRVHQSSVKSMEVVRLRAGRGRGCGYGVVTGGDDNALAWTTLLREEEEGEGGVMGFRAEVGSVVERAHAAAITGVAILEEEEEGGGDGGEVRFVSVSNDQWVKAWRVLSGEGGRKRIRLLGEAYSGVADAGDVAVLRNKEGGDGDDDDDDDSPQTVVVAGVGLEVWRLGSGRGGRDVR